MQFLCFSQSVLRIASALLFFSPELQSIYLSFLPVGPFIRGDRALSTGASPWLLSRTVMDTGGRQQPVRRSMALESLCASRVLAGMWWLIISPQKCSVMPLIGFNLVSFSLALRLHLLFASLSRKLL